MLVAAHHQHLEAEVAMCLKLKWQCVSGGSGGQWHSHPSSSTPGIPL